MFFTDEDVTIHDSDFEFYLKGKPTGQYAKGRIIKRNGSLYILLNYIATEKLMK